MKNMHMPAFLGDVVSVWAKIRTGWWLQDMRPIDSLEENEIPILFIHGETDMLIPPEHSKRMKEATKGYAEVEVFPGAGHASCVFADGERYEKNVKDFILQVESGRHSSTEN